MNTNILPSYAVYFDTNMQNYVDNHIYSINKQYINKNIVTGAKNNHLEQLGHSILP